jgi:Na+(H+)/acetate symporter ActP
MGETAAHLTHKALTGIDIAIIAVYFVVIFAIGFYFARKERTSTDYFLASRDVGWFAIGASLFVSNISTEHFIGLAGSGASSGLAVGSFEWLACLILLVLGWVFVPFYLRSNVFTMPEFLERRFSRSCAVYLAGISILAYVFTKISVHLYAAAIVLERVVGWSPLTAAVILVIATGIYTIAGGLAAVIYTDLVQTLILIFGAVILTVIGMHEVGGICRPARRLARQLLPHGQAHERSRLSLDRNFLRRAHSRHLVLVHRPGDCAARALGQGRRTRQGRHHFCRLSQGSARIHAGAARLDCGRALSRPVQVRSQRRSAQRGHCLSHADHQSAPDWTGRRDDRRPAGGIDGGDEFGLQFGFDPGHARLL